MNNGVLCSILLSLSFCFCALFPAAASAAQAPGSAGRPPLLDLGFAPYLPGDAADASEATAPSTSGVVPWSGLAFQAYRDRNWDIYYSTDGGLGKRLTTDPARDAYPSLNRGATRVAFASDRDGDYEIYVVNTDGSGLQQLTFNSWPDVRPTWSPDGRCLAFESYSDEQADIYRMRSDGGELSRLTTNTEYDGSPRWSPDGSRIVYVASQRDGTHIYLMGADGSNPHSITAQPGALDPVWSPDGRQIAFSIDSDHNFWLELWVMNSDGSAVERLYRGGGDQVDVRPGGWSPDGRIISCTVTTWVKYRGEWYWDRSLIRGWDVVAKTATSIWTQTWDTAWYPDWQSRDVLPPESHVAPLPQYSPLEGLQVWWFGTDPGGSGVQSYDVEVAQGSDGPWTPWLTATTLRWSAFVGTPGQALRFRCRARDLYNQEAWPREADAMTTLCSWVMSGSVSDNRGLPLQAAPVSILPAPLLPARTDAAGRYWVPLQAAGAHTLSLERAGYEPLAPTVLDHESLASVYLPPAHNRIVNGGFESGPDGLDAWTSTGGLPLAVVPGRHTGQAGVLAGAACFYPCLTEAQRFPWADSFRPSLGVDSRGTLHLAWDGAKADLLPAGRYYSQRAAGGEWSEPELLAEQAGSLLLAVDSGDGVHIVTTSGDAIIHRRRLASGRWSAPTTLMTKPALWNYLPSPTEFLADRRGGLHLLASYGGVYIERTPEGVWQPWMPSAGAGKDTNQMLMALGPDDSLVFVWQQLAPGESIKQTIAYRQRRSNGVWGPVEFPLPAEVNWPDPRLVQVGPDGRIHLIFASDSAQYHTMCTAPGDWTEPQLLPKGWGAMDAAFDTLGTLHLVSNDQGKRDGVDYRHWTPAEGWSVPAPLHSGECADTKPALAVDPFGRLHLFHSGPWSAAALMRASALATESGVAELSQIVEVPPTGSHPTLAFMARHVGDLPSDASALEVWLDDGGGAAQVPLQGEAGAEWALHWADLEPWAGQTATVTLRLRQEAGDPLLQLWLDDVSLGAAYPDARVTLHGPAEALPGDRVVYELRVDNPSSLTAGEAVLTLQLPPEMRLLSADPLPDGSEPEPAWDLGELGAGAGPRAVRVTAEVRKTAPRLSTLTAVAQLTVTEAERETANNEARSILRVQMRAWLPLLLQD